jgi:hypothetical protein
VIALCGCVPIDGGAVELRWTVRRDGRGLSCSRAGIDTVTLLAERDGGESSAFVFDCEAGHGTTNFELAEGRYLFRIEPAGPGAADVAVPNPITAGVREGEVTDLQVLVLRVP